MKVIHTAAGEPLLLQRDSRTGCWYRPRGTDDLNLLREGASVFRGLPIRPDDVVLDLGANIGSFTRLALDAGVVKVVAVEPEPENVAVLRQNVHPDEDRCVVLEAAVSRVPGEIPLYVNPGIGKYSHSTILKGGKVPIPVQAVTLGSLLAEHQPTLLKVDIECAEYDLPELTALPESVRTLHMELHLNGRYRQLGIDLAVAVGAQGFTCLRPPRFTRANWHTVPIWVRDAAA